MSPLFLLGGGDNEASYARTYWRFIEAATTWPEEEESPDENGDGNGEAEVEATAGVEAEVAAAIQPESETNDDDDDDLDRSGVRSIAIVIVPGPDDNRADLEARYRAPFEFFEPVRKDQLHVLFVSRREPLTAERLAQVKPTGIFVAGGCTPLYHEALLADRSWIDYVLQHELPYAGYSAGAVLLSKQALMGGWLLELLHCNTEIVSQGASEGLDFVEFREGLGLVPFTLEAHATQWGTLCRLTQLVAEGALQDGWAIDENCMLEIVGDELRVFGPSSAYRVQRLADGAVRTDVHRAGAVLRRGAW